jgi:hypothetical protein
MSPGEVARCVQGEDNIDANAGWKLSFKPHSTRLIELQQTQPVLAWQVHFTCG